MQRSISNNNSPTTKASHLKSNSISSSSFLNTQTIDHTSTMKRGLSRETIPTQIKKLQNPKIFDFRNQQVPSILKQHHSQAQLLPSQIIYNYYYPLSRKNMKIQEDQTISKFFNVRNQARVPSTTMNVYSTLQSNKGSESQQSEGWNRKITSSQQSVMTSTTYAQNKVRQLVDLQEMYYHYKRLERLYLAFKGKEGLEIIQKIIDSIIKAFQREKLQCYEDLLMSEEKKHVLHKCQNLEIIFIYYLELTIIELLGRFSQNAKISSEKILYYLVQSFLSLIEIVLYRIPNQQRNNKWALSLIEIVAVQSAGNNDVVENFEQSQVKQREAIRRIKEQNEIIIKLFQEKILPAKVKSFTGNFQGFLKNIETTTPQKQKDLLYNIQQFSRSKRPVRDFEDEYVTDNDVDLLLEQPTSAFDSVPQDLSRKIKEEKTVNKYEKFLGRIQQEKHGGYLPKLPIEREQDIYTLVLDLDETLVHYAQSHELTENEGSNNNDNSKSYQGDAILFRPHLHEFLTEMSQIYEIVIFTAALQDYADYILDKIDPDHDLISFRLYRQHSSYRASDGVFIKDLAKLGRDIKRVIILDNVKENFQLQKENGIFIKTWLNDQEDTLLLDLVPLLKQIVAEKIPDVRVSLRNYRDTVMRYIQIKGTAELSGLKFSSHNLNDSRSNQVITPNNQSRLITSKDNIDLNQQL